MFNFYSTAGLIFGNETSLNSCSQIIDTLGKNIFVVSDRGLTELGLIEPTIKNLKKIVILIYLMMLSLIHQKKHY